MKTLDIILLIPLVFGAVLGFRKGLLLEIFGVLAFVLAIIGGFKLMETGMVYLSEYFEDFDQLLPFISFFGHISGHNYTGEHVGQTTQEDD